VAKGKVKIIAEAGVNHNGSLDLASEMINEAKSFGADIIKFQSFKSNLIATPSAEKASYQKKNTGNSENQFQMLKGLELSFKEQKEIKKMCDHCEIQFLSTPFDEESAKFLSSLGLKTIKIASGEITNLPLLEVVATKFDKIIMSTGMADLDEIDTALKILLSKGVTKGRITLLHCTTEYPAPFKDLNLRAMKTIKETFDVDVGYSDHSLRKEASIAAVALGAKVIEKHFTLDRSLPGPDHKASLEPKEFQDLIKSIRNIELALGSSEKKPSKSELKNIPIARKSLYARCDIRKGEEFGMHNLIAKRPALGISPMRIKEIINMKAKRNFQKDDLIQIKDFSK
jgi:N,N'-diacetyllegionaminate synthase